jgi:hypothetical protein
MLLINYKARDNAGFFNVRAVTGVRRCHKRVTFSISP